MGVFVTGDLPLPKVHVCVFVGTVINIKYCTIGVEMIPHIIFIFCSKLYCSI